MDRKSQLLLIVVQSVIIGLLILYLIFSTDSNDESPAMDGAMVNLQHQLEICAARNDSLAGELMQIRVEGAVPPFLDKQQVENLKKKGLADPLNDIRNDLGSDPTLINTPAVLGSEMGFYFHEGIHILNEKWVFAYFEDGHIAGAILLEYDIQEDGSINWEVIDETTY